MAGANLKPSRFERICVVCGNRFRIGEGRGQARTHCYSPCRPIRKVPTKPCEFADCVRTARTNGAKYCEAHYYQVRRRGVATPVSERRPFGLPCEYCGRTVDGNDKFCSPRCEARSNRGIARFHACATCGANFEPVNGNVTCSSECKRARARHLAVQRYRRLMSTPKGMERIRSHEYKRKARKRKAYVEEVSRDEVMRLSGWTCHLCGERIPKGAIWPEPLFGTVDHVVPLAKGGAHAYFNCKAAHLVCNCRKGAKTVGQLGLEIAA
jgi:5-methylcytosine-specific restriction endonuclease McrA